MSETQCAISGCEKPLKFPHDVYYVGRWDGEHGKLYMYLREDYCSYEHACEGLKERICREVK